MGEVNFYLKKAEPISGKSLIYLQYKYNGKKLVFAFGQTIEPGKWSRKKQRVRQGSIVKTTDGKHLLNDLLDSLQRECYAAYNAEIRKGVPAPATLKRCLSDYMNQNEADPNRPTFRKLLDRFIAGEIKHKGKEKSLNTIKTYNTLKGHLNAFEVAKKVDIYYNALDLDFLYKYITFLRTTHAAKDSYDEKIKKTLSSLPIGQNAIAKDVQIIKTVLKKAFALGESKNVWFQHEEFTAARVDTDAVYLTDREIMRLYKFDLSSRKSLEAVRDLFVFWCHVGLRYSDYSSVRPENIIEMENEAGKKEYFVKMRTVKTNDLVIIPCDPVVLQIFEKYKHNTNRLPKAISNQKFNEGIKEACRLAGFNEKGRLSTEPGLELWQAISSHTARRSFATNLYLEGFPVIDLMKITGHKTEKAFMRYIKVSKLDAAKRLNEHIQKEWSKKLITVAA
jgi:integrase